MVNDWLLRALEESRARGFLGPGPLVDQIEHAEGFIQCWMDISASPPKHFLDLGSGGGLPGLVLATKWVSLGVLIDSMQKRTNFLCETLSWDGAPTNIEVITGRAETMARDSALEGSFDLVTARSFGPPSVTAECAVRFLHLGGVLIVSEPPEEQLGRWNSSALRRIGLKDEGGVRHNAAFRVLTKIAETPTDIPREVGVPAKRPLF